MHLMTRRIVIYADGTEVRSEVLGEGDGERDGERERDNVSLMAFFYPADIFVI